MPYINVYVSPVLDEAIRTAAESGGKEWSRAKWLRKLAQQSLGAEEAGKALLKVLKKAEKAKAEHPARKAGK